jgi:anti-sigma regulatory factor (Ser/Thr protein kinase)
MDIERTVAPPTSFVHEALLYRDPPAYLAGTVPFIRDGLALGAPVLVAVPRPNGDLLRRELGWQAERITILDIAVDGRNPSRIIPAVLHAFVTDHAGKPVYIVGEPIWPGRCATEYPACVQHEALINRVFEGRPAAILCPYDARGLEPEVLADAANTHPVLVTGGERHPSRTYQDPIRVVKRFNQPLPEPPPTAALMLYEGVDDLSDLRDFVGEQARSAGLVHDRVVDLQIAANELATNTIRHTGGAGVARVWLDGEHVICDISDGGYIADPLAGRLPPPISSEHGRGLLLINYLCDLVQLHTEPGSTSIRVYLRR